jgi:rhamnogalacturonan endolyase
MKQIKICCGLAVVVAAMAWFSASRLLAGEKLDRGVVAIAQPDGSVYVGWRLLKSDPKDTGFEVWRWEGNEKPVKLNKEPITDSTNHVDRTAVTDKTYSYQIVSPTEATRDAALMKAGPRPVSVTPATKGAPYVAIPLQGKYVAQKATVADLDGDGALDYIIKQPNFNTDPYQRPGYWKKSEDTYKIEAYRHDGKFLWRCDMGWAIEEGIWYSPVVVYDLDGDGNAEVYTKAGAEGDPREADGRITTGPEYLVKLNGMTGKIEKKIAWPSRDGIDDYNYQSRNFLAIAYLDGQKPSLIVERGTYTLIKVLAYDGDLNLLWKWESSGNDKSYSSQGSHGFNAADVDGDKCDELVIGSASLDHNGKPMWNTGRGHPDAIYVADIDPDRPGLEIFFGLERARKSGAVCMADAKTGEIIWENPEPTKHVHGQGMCADIDATYPGMESYSRERDSDTWWLYTAKGERLKDKPEGSRAVWWDATPQKALIAGDRNGGRLVKYKGATVGRIEGNVICIADCLGDWREEIITCVPGELRIYTSTILATTRRTCLMQNRQYRTGVAVETMGYFYPPQLGFVELGE